MAEMPKPRQAVARLPDGREIEITIPAGKDSVLDYDIEELIKQATREPTYQEAQKITNELSPLRKYTYGAERAFDETAYGLKDLTVGLTDEDKRGLSVRRQVERNLGGTGMLSHIVGDTAMQAIPASKASRVIEKVTSKMTPLARALAVTGAAGGTGAVSGALKPVLEGDSRADNMIVDGVSSVIGDVGGRVAGNMVRGMIPVSPQARSLPKEVFDESTIGQIADRSSIAGKVVSNSEEALRSIPLVGAHVSSAREKGLTAWRNSVIGKATPDGFKPTATGGREVMDELYREFQNRYKAALAGTTIAPSTLFSGDMSQVFHKASNGIIPEELKALQKDILGVYNGLYSVQNGALRMTGEQAKDFESFLSSRAAAYRKAASSPINPNPKAGDIAKVYEEIEDLWSQAYRNQLPITSKLALQPLDSTYAKFKTVQRASARTGSPNGDFTPSGFSAAVKDRTPMGPYSRGQGILEKDADVGRTVYADKLPNSGTIDRGIAAATVLGSFLDPWAVAKGVAATLAGTSKVGKRLMIGDTKPQILAKKLRVPDMFEDQGANVFRSMVHPVLLDPDTPEY